MAERQSQDLETGTLEALSWTSNDRESSLEKILQYVSGEAQRAIQWYLAKKRPKSFWAQLLRLAAILATTVAGLIPLLAEISMSDGKPTIAPAWASVALVLAVALVGMDRFFGFSSAWMRFLTTEIQIRNALQAFQLDWAIQRAAWKGTPPSDEQIQDMLARCKTFLTQVNTLIENEMTAWIQEFQTALSQIDAATKVQVEATKLGGASVIITNGDQCDHGWELLIDGGNSKTYTGKTAALRDLLPGIHTLRVSGTISGKTVQAETAVTIAAGSTARVELEMV